MAFIKNTQRILNKTDRAVTEQKYFMWSLWNKSFFVGFVAFTLLGKYLNCWVCILFILFELTETGFAAGSFNCFVDDSFCNGFLLNFRDRDREKDRGSEHTERDRDKERASDDLRSRVSRKRDENESERESKVRRCDTELKRHFCCKI